MTKFLALAVSAALFSIAPALSHEDIRVIGEITQAKPGHIDVKMRDGKVAAVHLDAKTKITKDKAPADADGLKTGQFVVIDAHGDDFTDLLALEIRLVPPIAAAK
jgi:hypothetical protein